MALHPNFPDSPFVILDPSIRWFPADEALRTATSYNTASLPTAVTLGSNDSDAFQYDPNTLRLTQYKFNVASQSVTGNLTWNANGSLASLNITDPLNSANTQNCSYAADDLSRINTANCGAIWDNPSPTILSATSR